MNIIYNFAVVKHSLHFMKLYNIILILVVVLVVNRVG
jgi:hypothetical protein